MSNKIIHYSAETSAFDYHIKNSIKESYDLLSDSPFTVNVKKVAHNEIGIPHYGDNLEINICENVTGTFFVANTPITIDENSVILVPPNTIHFSRFNESAGTIYVLQIFFDKLEEYVNFRKLFGWSDYEFNAIPFHLKIYPEIIPFIYNIINCSGHLSTSISNLISIFEIINLHVRKSKSIKAQTHNTNLNKVIDWTAQHFCEKITIEDAAQIMNFNKYYFCKYFKNLLGIGYIEYVNQLRILHAIELLQKGKSATECCYECGFESLSYFTTLFKRVTGYTTKAYFKKFSESSKQK